MLVMKLEPLKIVYQMKLDIFIFTFYIMSKRVILIMEMMKLCDYMKKMRNKSYNNYIYFLINK